MREVETVTRRLSSSSMNWAVVLLLSLLSGADSFSSRLTSRATRASFKLHVSPADAATALKQGQEATLAEVRRVHEDNSQPRPRSIDRLTTNHLNSVSVSLLRLRSKRRSRTSRRRLRSRGPLDKRLSPAPPRRWRPSTRPAARPTWRGCRRSAWRASTAR